MKRKTDFHKASGPQQAARLQVFLYAQCYVNDYYDWQNPFFDIGRRDHGDLGPTRLAVVMGDDGILRNLTYTMTSTVSANADEAEMRAIHGNRKAEILWSGPESHILYHGPAQGYREPEITRPHLS